MLSPHAPGQTRRVVNDLYHGHHLFGEPAMLYHSFGRLWRIAHSALLQKLRPASQTYEPPDVNITMLAPFPSSVEVLFQPFYSLRSQWIHDISFWHHEVQRCYPEGLYTRVVVRWPTLAPSATSFQGVPPIRYGLEDPYRQRDKTVLFCLCITVS